MDDMIIKFDEDKRHNIHMAHMFQRVWRYNMKLNP